jgi:hypothetical protein
MRDRLPNGGRGRCLTVCAGVAMVVAAACSGGPSDPKVPFAIEFNRAPSPSVVLGETMFDSLGNAAPLRAHVYNSKGDEIVGAAVSYHVIAYDSVLPTNPAFRDSVPLTVDPVTGFVIGKSDPRYAAKTARVYAQAGGLQSQPITITATRSADLLVGGPPLQDSLQLRFTSLDSLPLSTAFTVHLRHTTGTPVTAADSTVPSYLVHFTIVQPTGAATDTSYVMLTNGDRKRSEIDTTDASGAASRQIRIRRVKFPFGNSADTAGIIRDTIVVQASAYRAGHELVPGSGVQFLFIIKAIKQ